MYLATGSGTTPLRLAPLASNCLTLDELMSMRGASSRMVTLVSQAGDGVVGRGQIGAAHVAASGHGDELAQGHKLLRPVPAGEVGYGVFAEDEEELGVRRRLLAEDTEGVHGVGGAGARHFHV